MPKSILSVLTYADSYDLTVLDTVKRELGIDLDNEDNDESLALLIHQVSSALATICNRVFAEETVSEMFRLAWNDKRWNNRLVLKRRPVSSIVSVIEDGETVDSDEYECDLLSGILYRLTSDDMRNSWCGSKITVNYIAGYRLLEDLPYDVEKAALTWIKYIYNQSVWGGAGSGGSVSDQGVKVKEVPGVWRKEYFSVREMTFASNSASTAYDPPQEVMTLIKKYIVPAMAF